MPHLFPIFVKLAGRKCLVAGGGRVAEPKIESLLGCGAEVRVVSPSVTPAIAGWWREDRLTWRARGFQPSDLDGKFLVIAATSSPEVNAAIFRDAESRGVLCNAVDEPGHCHFYYPAVIRRGDLQIAISTSGASPALASRLRCELEQLIGPEYAQVVERLGSARKRLFARAMDPGRRRRILHRLARFALPLRHGYERGL